VRTVTGRVAIGSDGEPAGSHAGTFATLEDFLDAIAEIGEATGATIQAFDAAYVAGDEHLRTAVEHAQRAMARGENVADSMAVEILVYAAGRRQIDRAMEMGVSTGDQAVVLVVTGGDTDAAVDRLEAAIEPADVSPEPARIRAFFDISEAELAATAADLERLVCERVALLDVEK
jgi:KEOPS complex subunit Cgi121